MGRCFPVLGCYFQFYSVKQGQRKFPLIAGEEQFTSRWFLPELLYDAIPNMISRGHK